MNSFQAKQLSLPLLLSKLGHQPVKTRKAGYELWYRSPFRKEDTPSFITSYLNGKWIWNDFGDTGGTVIDFVLRYENLNSVKDALRFLSSMFEEIQSNNIKEQKYPEQQIANNHSFFKQQDREAANSTQENSELRFLEAHSIENPIIYKYLENERCIPKHIADQYLLEVKYRNLKNQKDYFAFGMENNSGGFEVRAASDQYAFKSALQVRDTSLISGSSSRCCNVNIFEGMTDFLSLLVMYNTLCLSNDSIVMHSLSSFNRAIEIIEQKGYEGINTFLDNDRTGQQYTKYFQETFPEKAQSQSHLFAPYTDLNDALVANRPLDF